MTRGAAYTAGVLLAICAAATLIVTARPASRAPNCTIFTNSDFIDGLYTNLNLVKSKDVFRHIFARLPDTTTIYTSENALYFHATIRGKSMAGVIVLETCKIDSGIVGFSAAPVPEHRDRAHKLSNDQLWQEFSAADSVFVRKLDDFAYRISFAGRDVLFKLWDGAALAPKRERLAADEICVGPSFDESGMRFFLIYNRDARRFYWMLDEEGFVPDSFTPVTRTVVVGDRTEFAFHLDTARGRKLLVGVQGRNVTANNWYDGPFDQMPDNYVKTGRIELKKYLTAAYGVPAERIDRYGNYPSGRSRVLVAPYRVYSSVEELRFIDTLAGAGLTPAEIYERVGK